MANSELIARAGKNVGAFSEEALAKFIKTAFYEVASGDFGTFEGLALPFEYNARFVNPDGDPVTIVTTLINANGDSFQISSTEVPAAGGPTDPGRASASDYAPQSGEQLVYSVAGPYAGSAFMIVSLQSLDPTHNAAVADLELSTTKQQVVQALPGTWQDQLDAKCFNPDDVEHNIDFWITVDGTDYFMGRLTVAAGAYDSVSANFLRGASSVYRPKAALAEAVSTKAPYLRGAMLLADEGE